MGSLYHDTSWRELAAHAKARDGHRCTLARLFGGSCSERLHAHHVIPVSEGGDLLPDLDGVLTVCDRHHPTLHALRRFRAQRPKMKPCRCGHRYDYARRLCRERRMREAGLTEEMELTG